MAGEEDERRVYPRFHSPLTQVDGIQAQLCPRIAKKHTDDAPENSLFAGYSWHVLPLRWRLGAITVSFAMMVVLSFSRSVSLFLMELRFHSLWFLESNPHFIASERLKATDLRPE